MPAKIEIKVNLIDLGPELKYSEGFKESIGDKVRYINEELHKHLGWIHDEKYSPELAEEIDKQSWKAMRCISGLFSSFKFNVGKTKDNDVKIQVELFIDTVPYGHIEPKFPIKNDDISIKEQFVKNLKSALNSDLLLEKLSSLEHEQWSHQFKVQSHGEAEFWHGGKNYEKFHKWNIQSETPYSKLSEDEKDSDREWARKVIKLLIEFLEI